MNKILFNLILGIIITTNMWVFPVHAEEDLFFDAQTVAENLHNEESSEDLDGETVIDNDSETVSENETTGEGVTSEKTEDESGTLDSTEEELIAERIAEEPTDGENEGPEVEIEEELAVESAAEETIDGEEDEIEENQQEDPSIGVTDVPLGDLADFPELQTPTADLGADEKTENADTVTPAVMYARPVINSISTDGTSIILEWDNAEGALFQIYRWNTIPYVIGSSTTGSFVDTDVTYNRSYTYFIATTSSAYLYPYSQTASIRVRRPIEDIDVGHKLGEDLIWSPAKGEGGRKSLFISGSGSMPDFSSPSETPWHDSAGEIRHISIDDGVTYVGDHAFSDMEVLEDVLLPSSVREYGHDVFRGSTNLEFFNHESAVDGDQLHIAVQYLMGRFSGYAFEPEVYVRKGADGGAFDGMPELIRGRDYTVTYNNTTEVGDGTIEITFIGDYADAGSVVIPFIVVSELRKDEKIKIVTGIELLPSSSTYTGSAQHPDMIVRSGRWILKEGIDYILSNTDMVDPGTYTVTAQGIGAYSGKAQAIYTILQRENSIDLPSPVDPMVPNKSHNSDTSDITPQETDTSDITPQETEKERNVFNEEKTKTEEDAIEAETEPEKEEAKDTAPNLEERIAKLLSVFDSIREDDSFGKGGFSLGNILDEKNSNPVVFFVGAVGILASICIGVYVWFFNWFLRGR